MSKPSGTSSFWTSASAPADTFREVVEKLKPKAKRILGFTGTLCRSQLGASTEERIRNEEITASEKATEEYFAFIGPVLFRRSCADLEATGDIAKLHLKRIETPAISHEAYFCRAHTLTEGVTRLCTLQGCTPANSTRSGASCTCTSGEATKA